MLESWDLDVHKERNISRRKVVLKPLYDFRHSASAAEGVGRC